jgi:hypothetical protein
MEHTKKPNEEKESSASWASDKGSCTEAPHGATAQSPAEQKAGETPLIGGEHPPQAQRTQVSLEGLTEKVGTLGLRVTKRHRCGAATKRARKTKLAEAPAGDSNGGRSGLTSGGKKRDPQQPGRSGAQHAHRSASAVSTSPKSREDMQGTSKRQRPSRVTPERGQAKRPKQTGQLSYARVAREGLRMAIVCEDYPKTQITKENFVDIQRVIGRLVDELPEEGLTPSCSIHTGLWARPCWSVMMSRPNTG